MSFKSLVAAFLALVFTFTQVIPAQVLAAPQANTREVLLIQDAHSDEATQIGISKLLTEITTREKVDFIALEGAWTLLKPEVLQFVRNPEKNHQILLHILKHGELSGAELFATETKSRLRFEGLEDKALYHKYFRILQEILSRQSEAENFTRELRTRLMDGANKELHPRLKELVRQSEAFADNRLSPLGYLEYLRKIYRSTFGAELTDLRNQLAYPNLLRILALGENQKLPEQKQIARDFENWKNDLESFGLAKLFESELNSLAGEIQGKKSTREVTVRSLLESLWDRSQAVGRPLSIPENLKAYFRFHLLEEELAGPKLFEETETLTESLFEKLAATDKEREFLKKFSDAKLLGKLLKVELTREEWENVGARQRLAQGDPLGRPYNDRLKSLLQSSLKFYSGAELRDQSMMKNLEMLFRTRRAQKAIVITGGFHTAAIKKFLELKGIRSRELAPVREPREAEGFSQLAGKISLAEYQSAILNHSIAVPQVATMPDEVKAQGPEELLPENVIAIRDLVQEAAGNYADEISGNAFFAAAASLGKRISARDWPLDAEILGGRFLFYINGDNKPARKKIKDLLSAKELESLVPPLKKTGDVPLAMYLKKRTNKRAPLNSYRRVGLLTLKGRVIPLKIVRTKKGRAFELQKTIESGPGTGRKNQFMRASEILMEVPPSAESELDIDAFTSGRSLGENIPLEDARRIVRELAKKTGYDIPHPIVMDHMAEQIHLREMLPEEVEEEFQARAKIQASNPKPQARPTQKPKWLTSEDALGSSLGNEITRESLREMLEEKGFATGHPIVVNLVNVRSPANRIFISARNEEKDGKKTTTVTIEAGVKALTMDIVRNLLFSRDRKIPQEVKAAFWDYLNKSVRGFSLGQSALKDLRKWFGEKIPYSNLNQRRLVVEFQEYSDAFGVAALLDEKKEAKNSELNPDKLIISVPTGESARNIIREVLADESLRKAARDAFRSIIARRAPSLLPSFAQVSIPAPVVEKKKRGPKPKLKVEQPAMPMNEFIQLVQTPFLFNFNGDTHLLKVLIVPKWNPPTTAEEKTEHPANSKITEHQLMISTAEHALPQHIARDVLKANYLSKLIRQAFIGMLRQRAPFLISKDQAGIKLLERGQSSASSASSLGEPHTEPRPASRLKSQSMRELWDLYKNLAQGKPFSIEKGIAVRINVRLNNTGKAGREAKIGHKLLSGDANYLLLVDADREAPIDEIAKAIFFYLYSDAAKEIPAEVKQTILEWAAGKSLGETEPAEKHETTILDVYTVPKSAPRSYARDSDRLPKAISTGVTGMVIQYPLDRPDDLPKFPNPFDELMHEEMERAAHQSSLEKIVLVVGEKEKASSEAGLEKITKILNHQIKRAIINIKPDLFQNRLVLAYRPSEQTVLSPEQAQEISKAIRKILNETFESAQARFENNSVTPAALSSSIPILYAGEFNLEDEPLYLEQQDVNGILRPSVNAHWSVTIKEKGSGGYVTKAAASSLGATEIEARIHDAELEAEFLFGGPRISRRFGEARFDPLKPKELARMITDTRAPKTILVHEQALDEKTGFPVVFRQFLSFAEQVGKFSSPGEAAQKSAVKFRVATSAAGEKNGNGTARPDWVETGPVQPNEKIILAVGPNEWLRAYPQATGIALPASSTNITKGSKSVFDIVQLAAVQRFNSALSHIALQEASAKALGSEMSDAVKGAKRNLDFRIKNQGLRTEFFFTGRTSEEMLWKNRRVTAQYFPARNLVTFDIALDAEPEDVLNASEIQRETFLELAHEEARQLLKVGASSLGKNVRLLTGHSLDSVRAVAREYAGGLFDALIPPAFASRLIELEAPAVSKISETRRRVFEFRGGPQNSEKLDPVILYALHHPEMRYTLLAVETPEKLSALLNSLERYSKARYKVSLPKNFRIVRVDSVKHISSELQKLVSAEKTPAGFVSEDPLLAGTGFRANLLRVVGSRDTALENATVIITAEKLKEEIPASLFYKTQTGKDLDEHNLWSELVEALRARTALLQAA